MASAPPVPLGEASGGPVRLMAAARTTSPSAAAAMSAPRAAATGPTADLSVASKNNVLSC